MRCLLLALCLFICSANVSVWAKEPTRFEMETIAVWHEARGEPLFVQQLVLDTIRNRQYNSSKSLEQVLSQRGQFSWHKRIKTWKLNQEQAEFGFRLMQYSNPVRSKYKYFNQIPLDFTKKNVKRGNLYFSVA